MARGQAGYCRPTRARDASHSIPSFSQLTLIQIEAWAEHHYPLFITISQSQSQPGSTSVEMSTTDALMRIIKRDQLRESRLKAESAAKRPRELGLPERAVIEQEGLPWALIATVAGFFSLVCTLAGGIVMGDRGFSLGCGRPASQFDTDNLDVDAFIAECKPRASESLPASTGDFFIASQVQLMFIGRDLCAWLETMRDKKAGWSWERVQEMNERLDKWSRDWTWSSSRYLPYLNSSTRIARMYSEHVRLSLNSLALRTDLNGEVVAKCLDKALNSAMAIIQMQHDSATTDGGMSYSIDYLTIVLATAAVFLIRLVRSQPRLLDTNVGTHYIKMAVSALETSERSHTKLSTHLAKTVRDMARVARLTDAFPHTENSPERTQGNEHASELDKMPLDSTFEALLAFQNQSDGSYLELLFGSEKGRRKPDKNNITFACDYPTYIHQGNDTERGLPDTGDQQTNAHNANKRSPVLVALVDLDPAQMDSDEYGAELGKEARVWKVYVQETDKWDRELVDGWNKSLDVILVFAALFSAVSTAFLIESSAMLQQDPNDVSATVLLAISQTLLVIANGSSVDLPTSTSSSPDPASSFSPSQHAVIVNCLWYLSLSLSIATSLLAMLAKDWCHSFTSNRTGHPWDQALRRQRKWTMIERWKMQELITVLPSLIHLSLLLFSIGLCVYVWDMNTTAAIPVVCVAGASFVFYLWCSSMASVVALFPYTTIVSRVAQSDFMDRQYKLVKKYAKQWTIRILSLTFVVIRCLLVILLFVPGVATGLACLPLLPVELLCSFVASGWSLDEFELKETYWFIFTFVIPAIFFELGGETLYDAIRDSFARAQEYIKVAHVCIVKDNQDEMISLALQWLIQNCETPSSVAIALQAIAGASSRIPIQPLISCQATLQIFRRLASSSPDSQTKADAELYTRALSFLESGIKSSQESDRGQDVLRNQRVEDDPEIESSKQTEGMEVMIWDLKAEHERQVVELINSTQILPTKENIEALSIGSTATSLGLRLLKGDTKPGCEAFNSIIKKLYDPNQRLDPAARQSFLHAAIVLTLCSKSSLFPSGMVQELVELYAHSLRIGYNVNPAPTPQDLQPTNDITRSTALILCVLLHPSTSLISGQPHLNMFARAQCAVDMLTGNHLKNNLSQTMFYCVGLLAILFSPERYGITCNIGDTIDKKRVAISKDYLSSGLLLSRDIQGQLRLHPQTVGNHPEIVEFLSHADQVSKLTGLVTPQGTTTTTLPVPVYWVLVYLGCVLRPDDQQQQCQRLLSKSGFPKLDKYLNCAIDESIASRNILEALWDIYERSNSASANAYHAQRFAVFQQRRDEHARFNARSRQLISTQFWLLLCLIGDASTELQKDLKTTIERDTGLGIRSQGVDSVKANLEEEIIHGYERGHQFGLYSARIIECILQARGVSPVDDLFRRIRRDLNDVPSNIRGLSSFLDQPVNPQSDPPGEHSLLDSSRASTPPAPDVHTVNQSNERIQSAETDPPLVLPSTYDPNTGLPPLATAISTLPDAETDGATAESTVDHVTIPILPDATGPDNP